MGYKTVSNTVFVEQNNARLILDADALAGPRVWELYAQHAWSAHVLAVVALAIQVGKQGADLINDLLKTPRWITPDEYAKINMLLTEPPYSLKDSLDMVAGLSNVACPYIQPF